MYADSKFWLMFHFYPKYLINDTFRGIMGYDIDWKNPRDLNEKINWMKLYADTSEWARLSDKYLARDYIREKIGDHVLPKLYGIWEHAEDIDFSTLPNKFVMKTNHGSGGYVLVHDKNKLDIPAVRAEMAEGIKQKYGYSTIEPHYLGIKPKIMAEQLIENDSDISTSIIDYKVWCINGVPKCILVVSDRINNHCTLAFYDLAWNHLSEVNSGRHAGEYKPIPRPDCLEQMLEYARILANGMPQVRVDFYIETNKIYVGELTFTSQGGYMDYLSRDFSLKLGKEVPLIKKQ